jgi:hypothetical protein
MTQTRALECKKQKTKNLFSDAAESKSTSKFVMLRKGKGQRTVKLKEFINVKPQLHGTAEVDKMPPLKNAASYMRCSDTLNQTIFSA